jgi:RNA polymerase sigma-70 factor (ECF subfamily)
MGVAINTLGNRDDALDELQNSFWNAYAHLRSFNRQSKFSTWVVRIVLNRCLMRIREQKRLRFVPFEGQGTTGDEFVAHEAVASETPEEAMGKTEVRKALTSELRRIPIILRVPLELRYIQDLELHEIAARLNITVAATKSRLHRAHLYLRERMQKHCGMRGLGTLIRV